MTGVKGRRPAIERGGIELVRATLLEPARDGLKDRGAATRTPRAH